MGAPSTALIDEAYLEKVRQMPCWFCLAPPRSDPHHVRNRARGEVHRNDYGTMPLCRECHSRLGNITLMVMLAKYGSSPEKLADWVARQVAGYFQKEDIEVGI